MYEEGKRVLCPGGVLCFIGYELPKFVWNQDPSKEDLLNAALMDVRQQRILFSCLKLNNLNKS